MYDCDFKQTGDTHKTVFVFGRQSLSAIFSVAYIVSSKEHR